MSNEVIRFLFVGGCVTGVDFVLYMLLSQRLPITASNVISMLLASAFSYVINKGFTFRDKKKTDIGQLVRFYTVFLLNFATNVGVNTLLYSITGHKIVSYALATLCAMVVNYLGQRFFVFRS